MYTLVLCIIFMMNGQVSEIHWEIPNLTEAECYSQKVQSQPRRILGPQFPSELTADCKFQGRPI